MKPAGSLAPFDPGTDRAAGSCGSNIGNATCTVIGRFFGRRTLSLAFLLALLLVACGGAASQRLPADQLPNPAIYSLTTSDLPQVGVDWQQSYNQTSYEQGYNWSYQAYQAYQPGNSQSELDNAYAVNNDVYLYENDMRRADLPQPPSSLGDISNVSWKTASQLHEVGDKSAVWKTTLGNLYTPVWWLEFYKGHAYVRISLFGFPDQIAPAYIYGLADIVAERLPDSNEELLADAVTPAVAPAQPVSTALPAESTSVYPALITPSSYWSITIVGYSAPAGETGMVSFADETGSQLSDGVLGSDDILADQGNGTGYEWVGWSEQTEPVTLTFSLSMVGEVSEVVLGIYHRDGLGIFVPSRVTVNGKTFDLAADAVPNNQRGDLTFDGPFDGGTVTIVLNHRGRGWIMLDEVRFLSP